jgi:hypothetical protein
MNSQDNESLNIVWVLALGTMVLLLIAAGIAYLLKKKPEPDKDKKN